MLNNAATTTPANAWAVVCVFFQQQGAGLFRLSGTEDRQVNTDRTAPPCAAVPPIYRTLPHIDDVPPERAPRVE
jgi:hypothetical protein